MLKKTLPGTLKLGKVLISIYVQMFVSEMS